MSVEDAHVITVALKEKITDRFPQTRMLIHYRTLRRQLRQQAAWKDIPFRFWFPAFKVRPEDLLRFSKYLTLSQPAFNLRINRNLLNFARNL